jgi:K+-transporting ATPase ATPase C chain
MRTQIGAAIRAFVVITVLLGLAYPLAVTAVGQLAFHDRANGSLVRRDGAVVGSSLIGQNFEGPEWFHSRPSAAGAAPGYDTEASAASNLGPSNPDLIDSVTQQAETYRAENGLADNASIPVDAVTSSGSGLDPQISIANADIQAVRVAQARGLAVERVLQLVKEHTSGRTFGFLGEPGVNVLTLNLALDEAK